MKRHRSQPEWTSAGFISDDLTIKQNENNNTSFKDYNLMHKKKSLSLYKHKFKTLEEGKLFHIIISTGGIMEKIACFCNYGKN